MPPRNPRFGPAFFATLCSLACGPQSAELVEASSAPQGQAATTLAFTGVRGNVGGLRVDNDALWIRGWACDVGVGRSIAVHVYVGGAAGTGTILSAGQANLARETAVSTACATTGVAHGFDVAIPRANLAGHLGQALYVHGISASGGPNLLLSNSGTLLIPSPLPPKQYALSSKLLGTTPATDLTIAEDEVVTIDTNADLGLLFINGTLRCPASARSFTLKTEGIMVHGANALLECGTEAARFPGRLALKLKGGRPMSSMEGERAVSVMAFGTLRLFGRENNFGWQRLTASIQPGDRSFTVSTPVDWSQNDTVVIGATGMNPAEAEELVVDSVSPDGSTVTVRAPGFAFAHNGQQHEYTEGTRTWTLDDRAEVANLTRNIVISADGDPATLDVTRVGAHVMVMKTAFGYVDGVEFDRVGQLGIMGKYPFHWHLAGDVPGQFIKNSSIHNSYQRCVTVHGTNYALVQNNVCFNHFGHGYFLENGNETNNSIIGNLGMKSKRVPLGMGLLFSDMQSSQPERFAAPATFWVSNPKNIVRDNVASGSEGSGFWMAFSQGLSCPVDSSCQVGATPNVFPAAEPTLEFARNVAHGSYVGITWDGAPDGPLTGNTLNPNDRQTVSSHYHPVAPPSLLELSVFRNLASGIYFRGSRALFSGVVAADNGVSLFLAYNQVVSDSLVVGMSPALTAADLRYAHATAGTGGLQGIRLYDGPFELDRVHFASFPATPMVVDGRSFSAVPFVNLGGAARLVDRVTRVTFSASPPQARRVTFEATGSWLDTLWTTGVRDVDGSVGGVAGATLVPAHAMNWKPGVCSVLPASVGAGYACQYALGVLSLQSSSFDPNYFPFEVTRVTDATGAMEKPSPAFGANRNHNKTGLILDQGFSYRLRFPLGRPADLQLIFRTEQRGALSPVVDLSDFVTAGTTCTSSQGTAMTLTALRASPAPGYAQQGNALYVRFAADQVSPNGGSFWSGQVAINCR